MAELDSGPLPAIRRLAKRWLGTVIVFSFFLNLLTFVGPLYMLQVYERVLTSRSHDTLVVLTLIAAFLLISFAFLEVIRSRVLVRTGLVLDEQLAATVFNRVMRLKLLEPGSNPDPLLRDADRLRDFLTGSGILALMDAPWVPLFLFLAFLFHPWLGLVALAATLLIFSLAVLNEMLTRRPLSEATAQYRKATDFAASALQNADTLRAMGMEHPTRETWLDARQKVLVLQSDASDRSGTILAMSRFTRLAAQIAILGVGALLVLEHEISTGVMIVASILLGRALAPVEQAVAHWRGFVQARQSYQRLTKLFERLPDETDRIRLPTPKGKLEVASLTARPPGSSTIVLRNVSVELEPGDGLAVLGGSGSGKSTLLRHMTGVTSGASGEVRLDGVVLQHWPSEQLGAAIGYMPQQNVLFSGTVAENIGRFQRDLNDEQIVAAARLAGAHDIIRTLPDGYETHVGAQGERLSGGQRQQIALARAVFGFPKLIILDEPNSALDKSAEEALLKCILALRQLGSTVVCATHASSLVAAASKMMVLEKGVVKKLAATKDPLADMASGATASPN